MAHEVAPFRQLHIASYHEVTIARVHHRGMDVELTSSVYSRCYLEWVDRFSTFYRRLGFLVSYCWADVDCEGGNVGKGRGLQRVSEWIDGVIGCLQGENTWRCWIKLNCIHRVISCADIGFCADKHICHIYVCGEVLTLGGGWHEYCS